MKVYLFEYIDNEQPSGADVVRVKDAEFIKTVLEASTRQEAEEVAEKWKLYAKKNNRYIIYAITA